MWGRDMDKRFAIFDMDGTLVDSMGRWNSLTTEYLHRKGVRDVPQEILDRTAVMTTRETLAVFIRELGIEDTPEAAERELWTVMEEHYRHDIPLKPGVRAYLEDLKAKGVAMCVVSATPVKLMEVCLRTHGVRDMFQFILSCNDLGAGKDRPDIYNEAARRLGVPEPEDAAVYEDALAAGRTAKAAGYHLVAVRDEYAAAGWEELKALADEVLETWE